ncbi:hypothetical protein Mycsm_00246 [Mycobacterium sp. JS623]|nr:hypothetical protein Mycsm_00246 [Mycobacterium sp. JS623]
MLMKLDELIRATADATPATVHPGFRLAKKRLVVLTPRPSAAAAHLTKHQAAQGYGCHRRTLR